MHTIESLEKLPTKELLALYNPLAKRPIKKFATRAAAIAQTYALLVRAESGKTPPVLVEDPKTRLLTVPDGVDPKTLTIDQRVAIAKRHVEVAPTLTKMIDREALDRYAQERAEREERDRPKFVIAALGRGYVAVGGIAWTHDKDAALTFSQRDAAQQSLDSMLHRNAAPDHAGIIDLNAPLPAPKPAKQQRAEQQAKKVAKMVTEVPKKAPKSRGNGTPHDPSLVPLATICETLNIAPKDARAVLRKGGARAPNGVWAWTPDEAKRVEAQLNAHFE